VLRYSTLLVFCVYRSVSGGGSVYLLLCHLNGFLT